MEKILQEIFYLIIQKPFAPLAIFKRGRKTLCMSSLNIDFKDFLNKKLNFQLAHVGPVGLFNHPLPSHAWHCAIVKLTFRVQIILYLLMSSVKTLQQWFQKIRDVIFREFPSRPKYLSVCLFPGSRNNKKKSKIFKRKNSSNNYITCN